MRKILQKSVPKSLQKRIPTPRIKPFWKVAIIFALIFAALTAFCACIRFDITLETDGNGSLYTETLRVRPFSEVCVRIDPSEANGGYRLYAVTVNGKDKTDNVHFGVLRFRCIWGDKTVYATFRAENATFSSAYAAVFV